MIKSGGSIVNDVDLNRHYVKNILNPIEDYDATNKTYVDQKDKETLDAAVNEAVSQSPFKTYQKFITEASSQTVFTFQITSKRATIYSVSVREASGDQILCDINAYDKEMSGGEGCSVTIKLSSTIEIPIILTVFYKEGA